MPCEVRVECYAGSRGDERPLVVWLADRRIAVRAIVDCWLSENHAFFRVAGDDGVRYLLRRDDGRDRWEMIRADVPTAPSVGGHS